MAKENNLVKFWLTVASVMLAIVVIVGIIVGYLFIAHKISVFTVNGYIDKLNKEISAEDVTTNLCTDEVIVDAVVETNLAFPGQEVFVGDSVKDYKLNTEITNGDYLISSLSLSGVQVAAIINILATEKDVIGHFCVDDRDVNLSALNIKLAELDMQNSTPTTCDMKMVFEVDFTKLEEQMTGLVKGWLKKKITAEKVYLTCNMTFAKGNSLSDYSLVYNGIKVNDFSEEDSLYIMSVFSTFFRFVSNEKFATDLTSAYLDLIFGSEESPGFINFLTNFGVGNYEFKLLSDQAALILK